MYNIHQQKAINFVSANSHWTGTPPVPEGRQINMASPHLLPGTYMGEIPTIGLSTTYQMPFPSQCLQNL